MVILTVAALSVPAALAFQGGAGAPARPGEAAGAKAAETCKLAGITVPGFSARSIPLEQFGALHAAVAPSGDTERWTEIPWETDLWAARQAAARDGKPLVMWIMDGHPLGCT
jgi:hypothetical protein